MNEAMAKSLLKMLGIDPTHIVQQIEAFAKYAEAAANGMQRVEANLALLHDKLDGLERRLDAAERKGYPPRVING